MASYATESVSFYLGSLLSNQPNLILQGDATTRDGKLRLTKVGENGERVAKSVGRALHISPIHIWNKDTNKPASFFTSFSFTIHAESMDKTADGLAFFLAPINDQPKTGAGYLGLFTAGVNNEPVVAVEFDTYINGEDGIQDPDFLHIGIDVTSIKSTDTVKWGFENHQEAIVYISYDGTSSSSNSRALKVTLVYPESGKNYSVSSKTGVDLTSALPEWVRVGFSGSSGEAESHDVSSWYFSSSFGDDPATLAEPLKKENPSLAAHLNLHFVSDK
ncbi:hypothetical protein PIB30_008665 [Stylosanthes scabra]|uniref:Legume lectin domain-containing protein n=1 Tax=Stylosanthes scabra TaxID=79078 RepID=A0ABU6T4T7_9FABA|nr:hypothetical protein [Stylosanthes scabra]